VAVPLVLADALQVDVVVDIPVVARYVELLGIDPRCSACG
jgi:hypothetical protein